MKVSIKWALVGGFIGLQIIPVSIILASSYLTSQKVLLRHAKDIMENIVAFTVDEAQGYLNPARDAAKLTQRLADSDVISSRNKTILEQYFYQQLGLHGNFAGIYLGSPSGEFLYVSRMETKVAGGFRTKIISVNEGVHTTELIWRDAAQNEIGRELDPGDSYDPRTRPWYKKAAASKETVWAGPYIFFTSKRPGLTAASPAFDSSGEQLRGVVGVDIEIQEISMFLSRLRVGKNGLAFIVNRNGDVVAFPDPSKIKRPTDRDDGTFRLIKINELDDVLSRKAFESLNRPVESFDLDHPVFGSFSHGSKNYHTMFAPFTNPDWPWVIGIYIPEDDYLGPIKENRLHNIYIMLGIAALASVIGLAVARSIVKPMVALQSESRAVRDEDLETAFDKSSVIKEIQDTAHSFMQMKEGLKETRRKNEELTKGLKEHADELYLKEMHLRATFTSLANFADALIVLDGSRVARFINPAAETLLGVTRDEVLQRPFETFAVEQKSAVIEIDAGRGGSTFAEMRVVDTEWEGNPALLVSLRDITERQRMEEEIRWRAETLAALHETALELAAQEALPDLLRAIGVRASSLLHAKGAGILLYRPSQDALETVLWHNLASGLTGVFVRRGEGVTGRVLASGKPIIVNDHCNWEGRSKRYERPGFDACVAVPIIWNREILGVLLVIDEIPREFHLEDIALLERFTPLAAAALEQRRLLDEAEVLYARAQQDAETKSILLEEVNHRVKNNLSAIIGLLYAERRHAREKENPAYHATLQDLINRMQGLATVHGLLTASEWRPLALSELAESVIYSALQALPGDKHVAVHVTPSPVRVPPALASGLAMALNEMSTNTVKHALHERSAGKISVKISTENDGRRVSFEFRDDGSGYSDEVLQSRHYSTGLYLIQKIVSMDLGGEMEVYNDSGAVTVIHFNMAEKIGEGNDA